MIHITDGTILVFAAVACAALGRPLITACIGTFGIVLVLLR
jgi:hypothetical protein